MYVEAEEVINQRGLAHVHGNISENELNTDKIRNYW